MEKRHFEDRGADYAKHRPTYPGTLVEALSSLTPLNDLAIDVGCGNGQLSLLLTKQYEKVLASDVSADQIAHANQHPNITYKLGPAEKIDAPDGSADLIVAAQAAHWFDLPGFYAEVNRLAKPSAVVALITYGVPEAEGPAAERVRQLYWDEIHSFWPEGREHVENGYRDFAFPFEPLTTPALNIERNWSVEAFIKYCGTWSAGKRALAAGRGDILEKAHNDLIEILGAEGTLPVHWPISIRAGRVNANSQQN